MTKSLLLVGVGGQGTILVSKILSEGLIRAGYDVKMSEIHGMSQRGGSVTTQIRFGDKVYSPTINKGEADVLVSFEILEAARYLPLMKKTGRLITNQEEMWPLPVLSGMDTYPEALKEELTQVVKDVKFVEARKIAEELGEARSQNIVMLGAISKALDLDDIDFIGLIKEFLPEKVHDVNIEAFKKGLEV